MEKLDAIAKIPRSEFLKSSVRQDIAKWNFYLAAQACLDIGNHLIAVKGLEMPERYEEIISTLAKEGVIPEDLAKSLEGMGGFRNLIAHGYFKIDLNKLYGYLKKTKDIKKFLEEISPYF